MMTTEAVLDHFMTPWTAAPATRSQMGLQLDKAKAAMVDSEGKTISLPGKGHVALEGEMHVRDDARPDPNVTTDRMHTELMANADASRCARQFAELPVIPCTNIETLRTFARRARMREGEVAASVIAEYQRWVQTNGEGRRSNPRGEVPTGPSKDQPFDMHTDEARERKARDLTLQAKALGAVAAWVEGIRQSYYRGELARGNPDGEVHATAASLYADAVLSLDTWCKKWGRVKKRGSKKADVWMSSAEVAKRSGMPLRTIRHQCKMGELPARKQDGPTGPEWWINLSACAEACDADSVAGMHSAVDLLTARMAMSN